jgi:hypothetical protein
MAALRRRDLFTFSKLRDAIVGQLKRQSFDAHKSDTSSRALLIDIPTTCFHSSPSGI